MNTSLVVTDEPVLPETDPSSPIKVCFYVFFPTGGISRYTDELVCALSSSSEISVEVVCSPEYVIHYEPGYRTWKGLWSLAHAIPAVRRLRFIIGQFINPARCIRHAREIGVDIVHFSNVNQLSFPFWKRRLRAAGLHTVVSVHDVRRRKAIINKWWENRQLKAIYRFADALFVHSQHQVEELFTFAGIPEDKIHIVPHGLYSHIPPVHSREETRAKLGIPADRQMALFFGHVRDDKNLDTFIEALGKCKTRPHLVIAGRSGGRHRNIEYYEQIARREGVDHLITFIPRFLSDGEVADLFNATDWVALPYRKTFTSQSGVLNVAAHFERPVLVCDAPVLQETIRNCDVGLACADDSPLVLAKGIDQIAQRIHKGHVHQFSEYKKMFSWQRNARLTFEVYKQLLSCSKQEVCNSRSS